MDTFESSAECWIQLNIGLVRRDGRALPAARAVFDEIAPLVEEWRGAGTLRCFFFMRKPPDVRLRFRVSASNDIRLALDAAMGKLQRDSRVATCFYSTYTPEIQRFGGPDGMRSAHGYFDADTRTWLCLDALERQGRRRLMPEQLLPALLHDLFVRAADGHPGVIAGCWRSLASEIATPTAHALPDVRRTTIDGLARIVGPGAEQDCLALCARANAALAKELTELTRQRRLARPMPDVLASIGLFSFHRHGFSGERSAPIVAGIVAEGPPSG